MSRKKGLKKMCRDIAKLQKQGYIPGYIFDGISTLELLQERIYMTRVLERKYPAVISAIKAWEADAGYPAEDADSGHSPKDLKIKAGITIQERASSERMFQ